MNSIANFLPDIPQTTVARKCRACGNIFDAEGLQGICDNCDRDGAGKSNRHQEGTELDDSWPVRARNEAHLVEKGPTKDKALELLPYVLADGTVAIVGDRGRGKTVLATWLAWKRGKAGRSTGTYTRAHDLFATIRRSWHPSSKEDEWTVLQRFRRTPFLVIDEFQERSDSDWENRTLINILDHRHASMLPTVMIANLSKDEFAKQAGPSLMSRLRQTGGIVECNWQNLR